MCKKHFLFIIFFLFLTSNAQEKDNHLVISKSLTDYYSLASENIHLHFNKSVYLTNETIWFKGYIIDKKTNDLCYETTNVYVRLLDKDKNEIINNLFLANNGIITGHFNLEETYNSGTYYIHTYTNFMNNFEEDESSIFPIEIINVKDNFTINDSSSIENATIEFSIEGGKLLYSADNTIGVHIKNCNGNGIKLKNIKVFDSKNDLISQFGTNTLGYGKFELFNTKNEVYKIAAELNGVIIEKNLPTVIAEGVVLSVNNYSDANKTSIKIKTNSFTLDKIKNKNYTLIIQKNNQVNLTDIVFENTSIDIILDKSNFFNGINTIRILDENNNSVAERIIYNHNLNTPKIVIEKKSFTNNILSMKGVLKGRIANFSISVLPVETISSFENNSMTSQLNFNSYLSNNLENYSYYFKDFNRTKQFELDLFLLNQKASKYNWKNILTKKPIINHPFDLGVNIEGTVNQTLSNKDKYEVNLISYLYNINLNEKLSDTNNFKFENVIAVDSTVFFISLMKDKSKFEDIKLYSKISNNKKRFLKTFPKSIEKCEKKIFNSMAEHNSDFPYHKNTIVLKDVLLEDKKIEKLEHQNTYYNKAGAEGYKINQDDIASYGDVLSFIRFHGYDVGINGSSVTIKSRGITSLRGSLSPSVFIDNVPTEEFDFLYNMSLNEVDEIYINKRGFGSGMSTANGSIRIYRKKNTEFSSNLKSKSKTLLIKDGFQKEIPFKNPIYANYKDQAFIKHGSIDWIPNVYTDENGNFEFKIPTLNQDKLLLNIQGIDDEGNFYYENIQVEVN